MKRLLMKELIQWKERDNRKPLILKGVRQCGKTYLLKQFGNEYYSNYVYFNFEETESLQKIFEKDYDTERILFELSIYAGKSIEPGTTLIIFDEIQECAGAITAMKYFCENAPEYHIVCAGSLLGISLQKQFSFPVGKVDFLTLYPMNFTEFIQALDSGILAEYISGYKSEYAPPEHIADKLRNYLRQYYIVGGMPEAVKAWAKTKNIEETERIQQGIINSYEMDFAKHAPIQEFPKLSAIWRSIPEQLAKDNKKFIFSHVKTGWRSKDLEDALEWMTGAGLIYKVCKIEKPYIPLSSYSNDSSFKIYMADVGILRKLSKLPPEAILDETSIYREFKGAMAENYVLCELMTTIDTFPYYWSSGNTAEVDFIIQYGKDIIPIEVKAEKNVKARSLGEYRKKYTPEYAVKTSMKDLEIGNNILSIPLYMISSLKNYLS